MDSFSLFKEQFDELFLAYLEQKLSTIKPIDTAISEHLLTIASGGKRLRPYIAYVASKGKNDVLELSPILHLLFGLELYHLFALIHDDIIDESDMRHMVRTLHLEFGIGIALLIGDLCLTWAHECIGTYYDSPSLSVIFSALAEETIVGQLLETTLVSVVDPTFAQVDQVIELKTARYTFIYPLLLGRAYGTGIGNDSATLVRFGRALGHAFQRMDNLADVFMDQEELGKEPCADFRNGIPTHMSLFLQEWGTFVEQQIFVTLFGNWDASASSIRTLLVTSGAYAYEKRAIATLLTDARVIARSISDGERWVELLSLLEQRFNRM